MTPTHPGLIIAQQMSAVAYPRTLGGQIYIHPPIAGLSLVCTLVLLGPVSAISFDGFLLVLHVY